MPGRHSAVRVRGRRGGGPRDAVYIAASTSCLRYGPATVADQGPTEPFSRLRLGINLTSANPGPISKT